MPYRLLTEFENLFQGTRYRHRDSSQGDFIAMQLFEDLLAINRSSKLADRVASGIAGVNVQNRLQGVRSRRGDGTFGELLPGDSHAAVAGYAACRGPIATIEIGVEVKILLKAMFKQLDRVINDLEKQTVHFRHAGGNPICVAVVGVNHAPFAVGYEADRFYMTDGKSNRHPFQEADQAANRLRGAVEKSFNEFLILPFRATNEEPYSFSWLDFKKTEADYAAALIRICREYDRRA